MKNPFFHFLLLCFFLVISCTAKETVEKPIPNPGNQKLKDSLLLDSLISNKMVLKEDISDTSIANLHLQTAEKLIKTGYRREALQLAKKAEAIFSKYLPESKEKLVQTWHNLGRANNGLFNLTQAEIYYNKALEARKELYGDKALILAESYFGLGNLYEFQDKEEKAIENYLKGKDIYDFNKEICHPRLADLLQNLSRTYGGLRDYNTKEEYMQQSLNVYLCSSDYPISHLANLYKSMAWHYHFIKKDYATSLKYIAKTETIIEENTELIESFLSNVYETWAAIHRDNGLYVEAENYVKKSMLLTEKLAGKDSRYAITSYKELGSINNHLNHLKISENYYQKALSVTLKILGAKSKDVYQLYNRLSSLYNAQDEHELALSYAKKSLDFWKDFNEGKSSGLSDAYENYGDILLDMGKPREALPYIEKSLSLKYDIYKTENSWIAFSYRQIGDIFYNLGDYEKAEVNYEKSLKIYQSQYNELNPSIGSAFKFLAHVKGKRGQYQEALFLLEEGEKALNYTHVDSIIHIIDIPKLTYILEEKVKIYQSLFSKTNNEDYLKRAYQVQLQIMRLFRYRIKDQFENATITDDIYICNCNYELTASVLSDFFDHNTQEEFIEELFDFLEFGKGMILRKVINEQKIDYTSFIDKENRIKEFKLKQQIEGLKKQRYEDLENISNTKMRDSIFADYTSQIIDHEEKYHSLIESFKEKAPEYFNLKHYNNTITIKGVQDSLLKENQALVEYYVGDSSIFTFLILKDTFYLKQVKKDFPLEEWVEQLRCGIFSDFVQDTISCSGTASLDQYGSIAHELYQKIFAEIDNLIPQESSIIIVPDGVLGYLPFDALLVDSPSKGQTVNNYHYLLKDHAISYAYSATLLQEMQYKQHSKKTKKKLLAMAPTFGDANNIIGDTALIASRSIEKDNRRNWLSPLKYNIPEVETIGKIIPGTLLTKEKATEDNFKTLASEYQILHLSTHGKANDEVGDFSFLAFYQIKDSLENEWLYNRELYNLKLNADMVVLSACETGIGELQTGEGIISMARGFSYAGAKSIITSLWSVNDKSTQVLMELYYQHLKNGLRKDQALRQTKLDYLENFPHLGVDPYYWAAFIPIGDMSPMDLSNTGLPYGKFFISLGIISILWLLWKRWTK